MNNKNLRRVYFTGITLAIFGTTFPMSSHTETQASIHPESTSINLANPKTNLATPIIKQGRAVNTKYPQMDSPTVEAISNDDGTGYLNVIDYKGRNGRLDF